MKDYWFLAFVPPPRSLPCVCVYVRKSVRRTKGAGGPLPDEERDGGGWWAIGRRVFFIFFVISPRHQLQFFAHGFFSYVVDRTVQ